MSGIVKSVLKIVGLDSKAPPPPPPPPLPGKQGPTPEEIAQQALVAQQEAAQRRAALAAQGIETPEGVVELLSLQRPAQRRASRILTAR
jgi:hypothetical protein